MPTTARPPAAGTFPATDHATAYNPAFDGLRAVAVVSVMFMHAGVPGFASGLFGVDVFFVLSGYLITSLLVRGAGQRGTLGVFYWHRLVRLAPALILVCASLLAVAPLLDISAQAAADSLAALLCIADWTAAFHAGGVAMYLGNTWSLAVEEQFYLIWPPIILGMLRLGGRRFVLPSTVGLLAASLIWQAWTWRTAELAARDRVYFGFDTHCSGLLIGCAMALATDQLFRARRFLLPASCVGAALLCGQVISGATWTPLAALGASIAAAVVIADLAVNRNGLLCNALCRKGPVAIGRISYAVYLWHYPILLIANRHSALPKPIGATLAISLTLICATASFFIVEQPARRLRDRLPRRRAAIAGQSAAALSFVGMAVGAGIVWHADLANLIDPKPLEIAAYGPTTLRRGEAFNLQPDGTSVMWIKTSRSVPLTARIRIGQDLLETNARGTLTTAVLPQAVRDRPGPSPISIVGVNGDLLAGPVGLEVSP